MALATSTRSNAKNESSPVIRSATREQESSAVVKSETKEPIPEQQQQQQQQPARMLLRKPAPPRISEIELDIARKLSFSTAIGHKDQEELEGNEHKVQIVIRIRPHDKSTASSTSNDECFRVDSETSLVAHAPKTSASYRSTGTATSFHFTRIFTAHTQQQELFESTTKPVIEAAFSGKNGLVFAYGVTNSGKTHTITGTDTNQGVLPRALQFVMQELGRRKENEEAPVTKITVSYLEIYNENVYDLLTAPVRKRRALRLQDCDGKIQVRGMMEKQIKSIKEAEELLRNGMKNKQVAETSCNMDSSRSHCIFSLYFYHQVTRTTTALRSKVSIVDLAGSERGAKTGATGLRMQEASKINGSLMNLMRCLETMRWNQQHPVALHKMVPFRESKLTRLFQENLIGRKQGPLVMIVAVNPSAHEFDETLRTLKYSAMARELVPLQKHSGKKSPSAMYYDLDGRLRKRQRTSLEGETGGAGPPFKQENPTDQEPQFGQFMKREPGAGARPSRRPPLRARTSRPIPDPSLPPTQAANATANAIVAVMQKEIEAHRMRTTQLELENEDLRVQLSQTNAEKLQMEVQIREEIGNEMRDQLQHIKTQYREMYQRQQGDHTGASSSSSSADTSTASSTGTSSASSSSSVLSVVEERAAWQKERAAMQHKISQLQEQLGECEDEIKRIQGRHQRAMQRTTRSSTRSGTAAAAAATAASATRRSSAEEEDDENESDAHVKME